MEGNPVEVVDVTNTIYRQIIYKESEMKKLFLLIIMIISSFLNAQSKQDSLITYKKRVLEDVEIYFLTSYYSQDGSNAAVTGGIGTEELTDLASSINISIPLNEDDVLAIDATVSSYTSASSSNLDPFTRVEGPDGKVVLIGSPWVESTGDSRQDVWVNGNFSYTHSSDDRNKIWSANVNFAAEYDYTSIGFGGSYTWLFNKKNTEFGIKGNVFLDIWNPFSPIELEAYSIDQDLNNGFFRGVDILDQNGDVIDKNGNNIWKPASTTLVDNKNRNTYSISLSFSQILSKRAQISIFLDIVHQNGWLSSPLQRVYFEDKDNFYIGNASSIPIYTTPENKDVFQLADDIERLPDSRFKIPIGMRFNYYLNEMFVLRSYYRFYTDDWGVTAHTLELEVPVKITDKITLYAAYRYYTQTSADYFAPYESNLSSQDFYTSDYDLSGFNNNKYSIGISYTDIFTKLHLWKFYMKNADLRYSHYDRSTGLKSDIISIGFKSIFK